MDASQSDIDAIRGIIARQFASLSWGEGKAPEWSRFSGDFHPDATLFASARPARPQSVAAFLGRMQELLP